MFLVRDRNFKRTKSILELVRWDFLRICLLQRKSDDGGPAEIATAINAKVKSVTDSYVSSYQQGENDESKSRYQSLTVR